MRFFKTLLLGSSLFLAATLPLHAQAKIQSNNLDIRIGMPTPKNLLDMKEHSIDLWIKSRTSRLTLFNYINEAADLRAYLFVCKRHDLNLNMGKLAQLSSKYLQAVIPAQYDEPELQLLEKFTKAEQQAFLEDVADDIYAFEFGMRVALQDMKIKESGKTKKSFCEGIKNDYFQAYIALLATANRQLD